MDPRSLRYFKRLNGLKGCLFATGISFVWAVVMVRTFFYCPKIAPMKPFFENYDPELEWKVLLESGLLKTVDKDDPKRLETQIRVFKRWLNSLLRQANAQEVADILDIFRDEDNLYQLCKFLAGQKLISSSDASSKTSSLFDQSVVLLEKLYGHEIATVVSTTIAELYAKPRWNSEQFLRQLVLNSSNAPLIQSDCSPDNAMRIDCNNQLMLGLDTLWTFIVTVRAGTGPACNLTGSLSSAGSTLTRRSLTSAAAAIASSQLAGGGGCGQSFSMLSARSPTIDRWLITQDERLTAWCRAMTEGYSNVNISNFTQSWRDGLAFLAICHQNRHDLFTYTSRLEKTANQNLTLAFHLATSEYATPRLLEPIDMRADSVDARATAVYLLELRKAIERDRKRRSRGILEIQTSAMTQEEQTTTDGINGQLSTNGNHHSPCVGAVSTNAFKQTTDLNDAVHVTVEGRSSPTLSTTSRQSDDVTSWLDDEFAQASDEEDQVTEEDEDETSDQSTLKTKGHRQGQLPDLDLFNSIMEQTLGWLLTMEERFAKNDPKLVACNLEPVQWTDYSTPKLTKVKLGALRLPSETKELVFVLLTGDTDRVKRLRESILARLAEAVEHSDMHQDLLAHLSRRQMAVGRCLRLGSKLIDAIRHRDHFRVVTTNRGDTDLERRRRLLNDLDDDVGVIKRQTDLLANRWNALHKASQAMGRVITSCLLQRQGILLIALRLLLEKLEAERDRQTEYPIGPSISELKGQMEVNRDLEHSIEAGEPMVERLDAFITIESRQSQSTTTLESVVSELATRWSRLVEWVNTRYAKLQNALLHWRHFEEEEVLLSDWLVERDAEVDRAVAAATATCLVKPPSYGQGRLRRHSTDSTKSDPGGGGWKSLLQRRGSWSLRRKKPDEDQEQQSALFDDEKGFATSESINASIEAEHEAIELCLAQHESRWAHLLASLDRRAQGVRESCGDTDDVKRLVELAIERVVDRWTNLSEPKMGDLADFDSTQDDDWTRRYVDEASKLLGSQSPHANGSSPGKDVKSPSAEGLLLDPSQSGTLSPLHKMRRLSLPSCRTNGDSNKNNITTPSNRFFAGPRARLESMTDSPGPPSPSGYRAEFESKAKSLLNWLDNSAEALELLSMDESRIRKVAGQAKAVGRQLPDREEDPTLLVDRISREAVDWRDTMSEVLRLGDRYRDELLQVNENVDELDQLFEEISESWNYLNNVKSAAERQLRIDKSSQEFRLEIDKINKLLAESKQEGAKEVDEDVTSSDQTNSSIALEEAMTTFDAYLTQLSEPLLHNLTITEEADLDVQYKQFRSLETELRAKWDKLSSSVASADTSKFLAGGEDQSEPTVTSAGASLFDVALSSLEVRKVKYMENIVARLKLITDLKGQPSAFVNQIRVIEKWLLDMRSYLSSVSKASLQSISVVEAQLRESSEAVKDMDMLKPTLTRVDEEAINLMPFFEVDYGRSIQLRLDTLHSEWHEVYALTRTNRDQLSEQLDELRGKKTAVEYKPRLLPLKSAGSPPASPTNKSPSPPSPANNKDELPDLPSLQAWMKKTKEKLGELNRPINSREELDQRKEAIRLIEEQVSERRPRLASISSSQTTNDQSSSPLNESTLLLCRANFADLESALGAERERIGGASYHLDDFNSVLRNENQWLDSVEQALKNVQEVEYRNLSELETDSENLEQLKQDHVKEDEERLERLTQLLADSQVMTDEVQTERTKYQSRLANVWSKFTGQFDALKVTLDQCSDVERRLGEVQEMIDGGSSSQALTCLNVLAQQLTTEGGSDSTKGQRSKISEFHKRQLDSYQSRIKDLVSNIEQGLATQQDIQSQLRDIEGKLSALEQDSAALDHQSLQVDALEAKLEEAKVLLQTINETKIQLCQLDKLIPVSDDDDLEADGDLQSLSIQGQRQLVDQLTSRHQDVMLNALFAIDRIESQLPQVRRLNELLIRLDQEVAACEEVNDYLESADCHNSRRDMLKQILDRLDKFTTTTSSDGEAEQLRQLCSILSYSTSTNQNESIGSRSLVEIEQRVDQLCEAKQEFRKQLEAIQGVSDQIEATKSISPVSSAAPSRATSNGNSSMDQVLNSLASTVNPPRVRQFQSEFRDFLQSAGQFDPPSSDHRSKVKTSLAEQKQRIRDFRQQEGNLRNQLKAMLDQFNSSTSTGSSLVQLKNLWAKDDRQGESRRQNMQSLESKITSMDQLIDNYKQNKSQEAYSRCVNQLRSLEQASGWDLASDLESLQSPQDVRSSPRDMTGQGSKGLLDESLLKRYQHLIGGVSECLNGMRRRLQVCHSGQMKEMNVELEKFESDTASCQRQLIEASDALSRLSSSLEASTRVDRGHPTWLKSLIDSQTSRLNEYVKEFAANKQRWQQQVAEWHQFSTNIDHINERINHLSSKDKMPDRKEVEQTIQMLDSRLGQTELLAVGLIEARREEHANNLLSTSGKSLGSFSPGDAGRTDGDSPPAVPPRVNSLTNNNKRRSLPLVEKDHELVSHDLERTRSRLADLASRQGCLHLLRPVSDDLMLNEVPAAGPRSTSAYVNIDWLQDLDSSLKSVPSEALKQQVEACLIQLADIGRHLTQPQLFFIPASSSPGSQFTRGQSDDILLNTSIKTRWQQPKPADLRRLDVAFWHGNTGSLDTRVGQQSIQYTPIWLKSKFDELEKLSSQLADCERATAKVSPETRHLIQTLHRLKSSSSPSQSNGGGGGPIKNSLVVDRLESALASVNLALEIGRAAVKRRRGCLDRWQTDLVDLDAQLAQIKISMVTLQALAPVSRSDRPHEWLGDLHERLLTSASPSDQLNGDHSKQIVKARWMAELNPRVGHLGRQLDLLAQLWARAQRHTTQYDQGLAVRLPDHIADQVGRLADQWRVMSSQLELSSSSTPPTSLLTPSEVHPQSFWSHPDSEPSSVAFDDAQKQTFGDPPPAAVVVVCAPSQLHSPPPPTTSRSTRMTTPTNISSKHLGSLNPPPSQHHLPVASPTTVRVVREIDQLTQWLKSVQRFAGDARASLCERFDQNSVNCQLQQAKLDTPSSALVAIQQVYHSAALQLKLQQLLTEYEAREPQSDRIGVETKRLMAWGSGETLTSDFSLRAEDLPKLWQATRQQLTDRSGEVERLIDAEQRFKAVERDLERWLARMESIELTSPADEVEEEGQNGGLKSLTGHEGSLVEGARLFEKYQAECKLLKETFPNENAVKLESDARKMTARWRAIQTRSPPTRTTLHHNNLQTTSSTPSLSSPHQLASPGGGQWTSDCSLTERLDLLERRLTALTSNMNQSTLALDSGERNGSLNSPDRGHHHALTELRSLQSDLNDFISHVTGSPVRSTSASNLDAMPDDQLVARCRPLHESIKALWQRLQLGGASSSASNSSSSAPSARLVGDQVKSINQWLAFRSAELKSVSSPLPLPGDLNWLSQSRAAVERIRSEVDSKQDEVVRLLQSPVRRQLATTDGSQLDKEELDRLEKQWTLLTTNLDDHARQLDLAHKRLSNFHAMFNDAIGQIASAHQVIRRWPSIKSIPLERLETTLEQTQTFLDACNPLIGLINNLDRQLDLFVQTQVAIDQGIVDRQRQIGKELDEAYTLTEVRIRMLKDLIDSTMYQQMVVVSRPQPFTRLSPPFVNDSEGLARQRDLHRQLTSPTNQHPPSGEPKTVPLADSVSYPWERCVHPEGSQVPYYKNHSSHDTQWDHPVYAQMLESVKAINTIQFAAYRTAVKLRLLQKTLCLDTFSISLVVDCLKSIEHMNPVDGGSSSNDPFDRYINVPQMVDCLTQLFTRANGLSVTSLASSAPAAPVTLHDSSDIYDQVGGEGAKRSTLPPTSDLLLNKSNNRQSSPPTHVGCGSGMFSRSSSANRDPSHDKESDHRPAQLQQLYRQDLSGRSSSLPLRRRSSVKGNRGTDRSRRGQTEKMSAEGGGQSDSDRHRINVCIDITLNWLLNVYDRMRKGVIRALSFKVALALLTVANLEEKYRYLFSLVANRDGCVTETGLHSLLLQCILVPRNLGESGLIGRDDFASSVKLCYNQVAKIARGSSSSFDLSSPAPANGIAIRHFVTWLHFEPQILHWLLVLNRLIISEQVVHSGIRCRICQKHPIQGLRYHCLRCANFDMCQDCFFAGRTARSHKLTHRMQEYCTAPSSSDKLRDITRIVRNRFRSRERLRQRDLEERENQIRGPSALRADPSSSGSGRGRSRCCDTLSNFSENKPRPAPAHGSDSNPALDDDSISDLQPDESVVDTRRQLLSASTQPTRSINAAASSLPPRAASDTRHPLAGGSLSQGGSMTRPVNNNSIIGDGTVTGGSLRLPSTMNGRMNGSRLGDHHHRDEHGMIANYSYNLRQMSQPDMPGPQRVPNGQLIHQSHDVADLMTRSNISEGLPSSMPPPTNNGNATPIGIQPDCNLHYTSSNELQQSTSPSGHYSLDRRRNPPIRSGHWTVDYSTSSTTGADSSAVRTPRSSLLRPSNEPMGWQSPSDLFGNRLSSSRAPNSSLNDDIAVGRQLNRISNHHQSDSRPYYADHRMPMSDADRPVDTARLSLRRTQQAIKSLEEERLAFERECRLFNQQQKQQRTMPYESEIYRSPVNRYPPLNMTGNAFDFSNAYNSSASSYRQRGSEPRLQRLPLNSPPPLNGNNQYSMPNPRLRQPTGSLGRSAGYGLGNANAFNASSSVIDRYGSEPRVSSRALGAEGELSSDGQLRDRRRHMEVRMQLLEERNQQLESQLKQLLNAAAAGNGQATVTNEPESTTGRSSAGEEVGTKASAYYQYSTPTNPHQHNGLTSSNPKSSSHQSDTQQ